MNLTKLELDKNNRMLRFGFGYHKGDFFIRVDLWTVAYRITFE